MAVVEAGGWWRCAAGAEEVVEETWIRDGCDRLIEHGVGGGSEGRGSAGEEFKAGGGDICRRLTCANSNPMLLLVRTVLRQLLEMSIGMI